MLTRVEIRLRLRDGREYTLSAEGADPDSLFRELVSGRRRDLLEDWVRVEPDKSGNDAAAVRGDEIVEVRLVNADEATPHPQSP
jgi:hypothetical protein